MTPIRISISEAAKLFGINHITIRRAIKEGKLSYVVVRGRYQLNFESVLKWSQQSARTKNKMELQGIGQYVEQWRIKNPLFSPNPNRIHPKMSPHVRDAPPADLSGGFDESAASAQARGDGNGRLGPMTIGLRVIPEGPCRARLTFPKPERVGGEALPQEATNQFIHTLPLFPSF